MFTAEVHSYQILHLQSCGSYLRLVHTSTTERQKQTKQQTREIDINDGSMVLAMARHDAGMFSDGAYNRQLYTVCSARFYTRFQARRDNLRSIFSFFH